MRRVKKIARKRLRERSRCCVKELQSERVVLVEFSFLSMLLVRSTQSAKTEVELNSSECAVDARRTCALQEHTQFISNEREWERTVFAFAFNSQVRHLGHARQCVPRQYFIASFSMCMLLLYIETHDSAHESTLTRIDTQHSHTRTYSIRTLTYIHRHRFHVFRFQLQSSSLRG